MPAPVQGTVCGPQVPGTQKPPSGTSLASLNPCPLKACCNIWGQCGTTAEFCTNTTTGAPGTAAPGTNGCISNCGTDIIKSSPLAQFRRVAYFESFNVDRPCLIMDVQQIDKFKYTHRDQFNRFVKMTGIKRIPSFGGWAMSTEPATYSIFRDAVTAANRQTFVNNLVNFQISLLPSKSVSIATPASYWYLKGFPIATMVSSLDYIVYMTYDLHGQWDFGNQWAQPGCPGGNCLRSHVNLTETTNALSMITKAGVPSNKLLIGITSYGRSFKMTTPGCTGPMCTYTGKASGAKPGRCTKTAGYISNAEINEIKAKNSNVQALYDAASDSDIVVYDGTEWVAYMTDTTKNRRISTYQGLNMGGVSDWAVDLQAFVSPPTPTVPGQPTPPAQSGGFTDPVSINGALNPYLKGCNEGQQAKIQEAWSEAATLAADHYEWWPGSTWQDAMTLYLGSNSKND
ncbi:glycoside hydrolase superfamily [Staphylotrichum tortipilum]|uniref:chitinase n=1 Tax=Staphylotrichum tortipilum TaxID=2831512 RepID=A0AAN6MR42_9PEZI|nr:glycoside hydrolase superfamily [Staphylotrichum longicolle]